jgi:hypothetical protein
MKCGLPHTNNSTQFICLSKSQLKCPISNLVIATENPDPSIYHETNQLKNLQEKVFIGRESNTPIVQLGIDLSNGDLVN